MLQTAFSFLIHTIFDILTFVLLLRFFMQWLKAPFQNPLAQMTIALSDFIVKPARRWIPSYKKVDLSTLVLAFVVQLLLQLILLSLRGFPFAVAGGAIWLNLVLMALLSLVRMSLDLFFYAILIQALLSWVNPNTPISGVLHALTRPILDPIRRWIPPLNGIDFSALIAMILLQMVNIAFISYAQQSLNAVF
ncbi:MAG: osmotic-shock protein [Methylophilaceae bacterium 17-44-8]|jgi:YggT family protein|nr:MAG: osmotic-shock protein [Methylophilales bacterium 28-44-11]OYZ04014.1 MAG: osmotic-shock protein [Methylophilales bacterium 16-45-7]OZA04560.1 MAG: osmotic-shock protein [Methylophilaceae bacterium 17-44-8]